MVGADEFKLAILNIEQLLCLPCELKLINDGKKEQAEIINSRTQPFEVVYDIVNKPIQLQCGCIISENIQAQYYKEDAVFDFLQRYQYSGKFVSSNSENESSSIDDKKNIYKLKVNFENHKDICPVCLKATDLLSGKYVKPLIQLFNQLEFLKHKYFDSAIETKQIADSTSHELILQQAWKHRKKEIEGRYNKVFNNNEDDEGSKTSKRDSKSRSLLHLFQTISIQVKNESESKLFNEEEAPASFTESSGTEPLTEKKNQEFLLEKNNATVSETGKATLSNFEFNLPILNTFETIDMNSNVAGNSTKSSNSLTSTIQKATSSFMNHNSTKKNHHIEITKDDENKEISYSKCFPMYRKRSHFSIHSSFFSTKTKLYVNMDISPDCSKFVLLSEQKWEVYELFDDFDKKKHEQPFKLLCCGKVNGDYGRSFNDLKKPDNLDSIKPDESYSIIHSDLIKKYTQLNNSYDKVNPWDHLFCKLMNNYLIVAGTKGMLRIIDLSQGGKIIKTMKYSFPIRCIDVDCAKNQIACGITGKDRTSGSEQALIVFQKIEVSKSKGNIESFFPPPITITLPYRDPINTLQFSNDGLYLSCSTCFENRFLIISLKKIDEPRLIMKSIRNIDNSLESEGITSTHIFPGNAGLLCVTSVAYNSPPIILDTKIKRIAKKTPSEFSNTPSQDNTKINEKQGNIHLGKESKTTVLQPSMLLRLDEIGSKIYKCEISPRNDSIAFLDKNGTVYLMASSTNSFTENNEKRRVLILDNVCNAYKLRESAVMKFNKNGHKLYLLDRKGILYIEDFAAGLPQDTAVTKCKQIN